MTVGAAYSLFEDGSSTERHAHDIVERTRFPLSALGTQDRNLSKLYRHWNSLRRDGLLPHRSDIEPARLKQFLGRLHIVDVSSDSPEDYWFRLFGSRVHLDGGRDYTSLHLKDYPHKAFRRAVMQDYFDVVSSGVPSYHRVAALQDSLTYSYSRLILPLTNGSADNHRLTHLLVCVHDNAERAAH